LIQDLLNANGSELSVQSLCRAGVLIGMHESSIRVALTRLVRQGRVEHRARGLYAFSFKGTALSRAVDDWQHRESFMIPWNGDWLGIQDAGVLRSDKKVWRHHLLALNLLGFRQLLPGLHVRPSNLRGGTESVRTQLMDLGLSPVAAVFQMSQMDTERMKHARLLWDKEERPAQYQQLQKALQISAEKFKDRKLDENVRESLLLGRTVIGWLLRDPLLPREITESKARESLTKEMGRYQDSARVLWHGWLSHS
jgi:phenylacetic acid degradation operon negative regulatory protein